MPTLGYTIYKTMFRAFIHKLPKNIVSVFAGYNWLWHVVAIALTFILVNSGFDWWYFESTRSGLLLSLTLPAAILGFFIPIILPVSLYIWGEARNNLRLKNTGSAVAQAGIVAWLISATYKALTGRIQPEFLTHISTVDISRNFNFGFLKHGIFWGWPSSHTAVAFAGAVTIALLYPNRKVLRWIMLVYALYIGLAVSISIHWFSDFLAGAILGSVIGFVAVKSIKTDL